LRRQRRLLRGDRRGAEAGATGASAPSVPLAKTGGLTASRQLSAISYQLSAISYQLLSYQLSATQLSAISYQLLSYQLSAISYQLSAIS
jgi:hypothetical protein